MSASETQDDNDQNETADLRTEVRNIHHNSEKRYIINF